MLVCARDYVAACGCRVTVCPSAWSLATSRWSRGWVAALEVVAAEVAVDLAAGEHVPVGDQDGMLDGPECAAVSEARLEALVLRGEVGVLAGDRGQGGSLE